MIKHTVDASVDPSTAATYAAQIADLLASPEAARALVPAAGWWPQSLAYGAVGVALLHIERARMGEGSWQRVHDWLACATVQPITAGDGSHLYYGAPALAFALHASADRSGRYARALDTLDKHITVGTRSRLALAHARMDRGELPALAEFDTMRGLTGLGALLLRRLSSGDEAHLALVRAVLSYLVRLSEPVRYRGALLPGWWSEQAPSGRRSPRFPGGHANTGMAHGIAGPLALLASATRRGITVSGQSEAIARICGWLDQWGCEGSNGPWWPYWITHEHLKSERPMPVAGRPSWCYGVAGVARAQQLAALATEDTTRQRRAEKALRSAMSAARPLV
ncbi:lanthionine synthetase C family protein, partial [Actinomadura adrarensis]